MKYYISARRGGVVIRASMGQCAVPVRRISGPYFSLQELTTALTPMLEAAKGNATLFEVVESDEATPMEWPKDAS